MGLFISHLVRIPCKQFARCTSPNQLAGFLRKRRLPRTVRSARRTDRELTLEPSRFRSTGSSTGNSNRSRRPIRCFLKQHHLHRSIHTIAPSYRPHWSQLRWIRIHSPNRSPNLIHWILIHWILIRCRHFHRMACCQSLNRWDRCRLVQIRYHFVLMIRNRNPMVCCHFAIRTQSPTGNLT